MHPEAFDESRSLMPPPPLQKNCSLPDKRLLGLTISQGTAAWPDEE